MPKLLLPLNVRSLVFLAVACLAFLSGWQGAQAQLTDVACPTEDWSACESDEEEPVCNYGPGCCQPRQTLFQWSYGTSFSGGAPLDEPLVTDRPDFTEASVTVGRGVSQLEFGYTYTYDSAGDGSTRGHSIGEPLLRQGVFADWFELRFGWNYGDERALDLLGESNTQGGEDLYLGIKLALTPQEGWLPEMAIIPQMTVPTGATGFRASGVLPGVNWIYGWEINDFFSTAGSTQFNRSEDGETGATYLEMAQSWTIGYSLTDRLGAYTEWFALIPSGADTELTEHYFNGGFTYLVNDDIQLDIRAGTGLNSAADDYFLGTGMSVRF